MGKRELLLALGFVIFGVVVYQVSAPADTSRRQWSVSGIIEQIRREVRGNQAQASATHTSTFPAPETLRELRINVGSASLTIIGEERADIQTELAVTSSAYDTAEAERTANETRVTVDDTGTAVSLGIFYPREGRQRAALTVRVPARLELRIQKNNPLTVSNVAALVVEGRGETTISGVTGSVQATQRGSSITLTDIGELRLTTLGGADARVSRVRGEAICSLQGGEFRAEAIEGSLEIDSRNSDITLEKMEKGRKPIRINANGGEVAVLGIQAEMRIDGRETEVRVEQTAAAPLAIHVEGSESVEVTLPADGFKIDARTTDGQLSIDEALERAGVKVSGGGAHGGETGDAREEQRVEATIRGGGPTITVRTSRGDIVLRSR